MDHLPHFGLENPDSNYCLDLLQEPLKKSTWLLIYGLKSKHGKILLMEPDIK